MARASVVRQCVPWTPVMPVSKLGQWRHLSTRCTPLPNQCKHFSSALNTNKNTKIETLPQPIRNGRWSFHEQNQTGDKLGQPTRTGTVIIPERESWVHTCRVVSTGITTGIYTKNWKRGISEQGHSQSFRNVLWIYDKYDGVAANRAETCIMVWWHIWGGCCQSRRYPNDD